MARELIPAVLCKDEISTRERCKSLHGLVDWVQIDVLDGTLYPYRSWSEAKTIESWQLPYSLELHLMVRNPEKYIEAWKGVSTFKRVIWHIEANIDHQALIKKVKGMGRAVGLAISPHTSLEILLPYLESIDRILILGVTPGQSGQTLIPETVKTVKKFAQMKQHPTIAFDGGITDGNLATLLEAGVEAVCVSSLIFNYPPIDKRLEEIRDRIGI